MDNEVVIHVKAEDETSRGYAEARRSSEKFRQDSITGGKRAGVDTGFAFAQNLGKQISASAPAMAPMLGSIGVAAAPLIASTLSAGIIGGAGLGGVVGGVMAVKDDARVKSAWASMGDDLEDRFHSAGSAFVQPVLDGTKIIKGAVASIDLEGIFRDSAQFVVPLSQGLGRAIEGIGDGIESLVHNAGPVIDVISDKVGDFGETIGEGMESLADNAESAADSLDEVLDAAEGVTKASFGLINGLMETKEFFDEFAGGVFAFDSGLKILNKAFGTGDEAIEEYTDATEEGTHGLEEFRKAAEEVNDELRAQADPVFALIDAQDDLAAATTAYDEAVKEHGKNSREAKAALRDQAAAALDLHEAVGILGDEFDGHLTPAMRATLRAAGMSDRAINGLEKQFNEARKAGQRFDDKYEARVSIDNYRDVNGKLNGLLRDLENFDGRWTATMVTNYVRHGKPGTGGGLAHGGIKGAADGGVEGGLTWTGENGPELLDLPPGTQVHSNPDSMRMAASAGGGGASTVVLKFDGSSDTQFGRFMKEILRAEIRSEGGNVQQVLGVN